MSNALDQFKQRIEQTKLETNLYSQDITPPTITLIATIFDKARHQCYINYMEGFKALLKWLTSDHTIPVDYELDRYPRQLDPSFRISNLLLTYELQELAYLLVSPFSIGITLGNIDMSELARVQKALVLANLDISCR